MLFNLVALAIATPVQLWIDLENVAHKKMLQGQDVEFLEQEQGSWMLFEVDKALISTLKDFNIPYQTHKRATKSTSAAYASAAEMVSKLMALRDQHPEMITLHQIGHSINNRPIIAMRITNSANPILNWRILGAHHGDELSSAEVAYQFAEEIVAQNDDVLSSWLEEHVIWIAPHINPDGIESGNRRNANNVDLNRNYSYQWTNTSRSGEHPFSEPETNAVRLLEEWNSFTAGLSLHSGATNLSWVWNFVETPTIDDSLIQTIAQEYADNCSQPNFYLINGAEWYITHGDTTDWSYGVQGTFDFTLEVSQVKTPAVSEINSIIDYHIEPMLNFIQWPYWISATLVDQSNLKPISGSLTLLEDGWTTKSGPLGHISRLVEDDGPWTIEVSAPGYQSTIVSIVTGSPLEVALQKEIISHEIICSVHETGSVRLDLPAGIENTSLYRGTEFIASLEEFSYQEDTGDSAQEDISFWQATGSELLSGVYHLTIDQEQFANRVLIVDDQVLVTQTTDEVLILDGEALPGEQFWQIQSGRLTPLMVSQLDDDQRRIELNSIEENNCLLQISDGKLFEMVTAEPANEPSDEPSNEPSNEPADDLFEPDSEPDSNPQQDEPTNEIDRSIYEQELKAGCQSSPLPVSWFTSLLVLFGMRQRRSSGLEQSIIGP